MTDMTQDRLDELEATESAALTALKAAQTEAGHARMAMAEQALEAKGIVIRKTPCVAKRWGIYGDAMRVFVTGCNDKGRVVCAPITARNAIHGASFEFHCNVDQVNPEVTE